VDVLEVVLRDDQPIPLASFGGQRRECVVERVSELPGELGCELGS